MGSLLLAGGLAAAALLVAMRPDVAVADSLPGCQQAGQACVMVQVLGPNGQPTSSHSFSTDDIRGTTADVTQTTYDVPGSPGIRVDAGTSVGSLLQQSGVDLEQPAFVEVDGPDQFGRHLLTSGEWHATGAGAPVMYAGSNTTDYMGFVREQRSASDDQNQGGPDSGLFQSAQNGSLVIVVHEGVEPLDVSVTATPVPGDDRSFTLTSDPGGGTLTSRWVFPQSGSTSTDSSPTYTFPDSTPAGTWPISVAVTDPDDGSFGWGTANVQIGAPATPSPSPTTSAGTGGSGHGHHGATHGSASSSPRPGNGHGSGGSASATPTAKPTSAPTPTLPPTLAPTMAATLPTALYPPTEQAAPTSAPPTPSATTATPSPTQAAQGGDVTGILLTAADVAPPSAEDQLLDVPDPAASAAPAVDPPFRVATGVWLTLGGFALLTAGAASESVRVRRRLRPVLARWSRIRG